MTTLATDLHLHEQLLLLALRDRKGTPESGSDYRAYALGGAILAELALTGCIRIDEGRRALVEEVPGADRPRNAILAEAFGMVQGRRRRRRASGWVPTFAGIRDVWHRTALDLCRRGILRKSESQVLLVFSRKTYPTLDPGPERDLLRRMREAISGDGEIEAGLGVVIGAAHSTGLLKTHFDKKLLSSRKYRLERIAEGRHLRVMGHEGGEADGPAGASESSVRAVTASVKAATAAAQTAVIATIAAGAAAGAAAGS